MVSKTTTLVLLTVLTLVISLVAAVLLTDAGDDFKKYIIERFFKAKATAEEKALEKAGSEKAQGFL